MLTGKKKKTGQHAGGWPGVKVKLFEH